MYPVTTLLIRPHGLVLTGVHQLGDLSHTNQVRSGELEEVEVRNTRRLSRGGDDPYSRGMFGSPHSGILRHYLMFFFASGLSVKASGDYQ